MLPSSSALPCISDLIHLTVWQSAVIYSGKLSVFTAHQLVLYVTQITWSFYTVSQKKLPIVNCL